MAQKMQTILVQHWSRHKYANCTCAALVKENDMTGHVLMVLSGIALCDKNPKSDLPLRTQPQGAKVVIKNRGREAREIKDSPAISHINCDGSYTVTIKLGVFKTMIKVYRKYLGKRAVKNLVGAALDFITDDTRLYYKSIAGVIKNDDLPEKAVMRFFLRGGNEFKREFPLVWVKQGKNRYKSGGGTYLVTA
jgi:hypothetical protein